jgi:hypothetical protein
MIHPLRLPILLPAIIFDPRKQFESQFDVRGTDIRLRISTASGSERGECVKHARYRSRY